HLSDGRFEFGTGRGAGSHEVLAFLPDIDNMSVTKDIWAETIGEFPKMWTQETYDGFDGKHWSLPPRQVLPKPWKSPHPPMWYAAGNVSSYEMAGRMGLGLLGFSISTLAELEPLLKAYKREVTSAEPVGSYVNDNMMVALIGFVADDRDKAKKVALDSRLGYYSSHVYRYHDTFPRPEGVPTWPELIPDM